MNFESPFASALNHLLEAESWARERLAPFAGETVELRAAPLPALRFAIAEGGRLAPAASGSAASLVISAGPGALAAAIEGRMRGEELLMRAVEVTGNASLAAEVMFLFRHLRWDAEEEASKLIGDVAARRLTILARGVAAWHADAARRVAGSLVEYAVEEKRLLVARDELQELAAAQARLRDGLERLEKRIARLGA
jgi:ubiquinone biosynthesis protein UbiJ